MRRRILVQGVWVLAACSTLAGWIDGGAPAPADEPRPDPRRHWAFQPVARPAVPAGADADHETNPVDAFLSAAQRRRGLQPAAPVEPDLWLRRVSLDLTGLLPTPEELREFRADSSPQARERAVDRLLASPHHGERWGRHWMDVWRYSDWFGLDKEVRFSQPHLWRWRDWIVDSLNSDKGYDRMVLEMLAGDELAPADPETLRATGFLARNWYLFNRNFLLEEVVEHTGRGLLGLTIQCARCHDHKYDPLSQEDYYRFRAFFEPHHARVDRVPGEPDRTKAGLPRAYDAFPEAPTFLYLRGDVELPQKEKPLAPAVPAALGGRPVEIRPVPLPLEAWCPDKQDFAVREALEAAERAVDGSRAALEAAGKGIAKSAETLNGAEEGDRRAQGALSESRGKPEEERARAAAAQAAEALVRARRAAEAAPGDLRLAEARLALASAKRAELEALLRAEKLEDAGEKDSPSWAASAREACASQRRAAVEEAKAELLESRRAAERAERGLDGLTLAAEGKKEDAALKAAVGPAALEAAGARSRLASAADKLAAAEREAERPAGTGFTPRKLDYPRAAIRYQETPPNDPYPRQSTGRRLALARWIADRNNPLTARVAVNHLWARHFGEPLVPSMTDFGLRAPRPVHAELLDWLASEFMESGWSMKRLHRLICLSEAYRRRSSSARADDPNLRLDPDNRYLWRMNPRRMEGEVIRDALLQLAGQLDRRQGGPDLPVAGADSGCRRTIYYRYARDDRIPLLTIFDGPSVQECYRRHETIVPQQALAMANSSLVLTRAGEIAAAIASGVGPGDSPETRDRFISSAFERLLSRPPADAERAECGESLAALAAVFSGEKDPPARARASLIHVLLNHNDFITIR